MLHAVAPGDERERGGGRGLRRAGMGVRGQSGSQLGEGAWAGLVSAVRAWVRSECHLIAF